LKSLRRWRPTPRAGTTTGTAAGSEGDMLGNEQLRQAREDIATRDAEIGELKQRVADLEKLKEQQQSLIAMKDNDLAAAQRAWRRHRMPRCGNAVVLAGAAGAAAGGRRGLAAASSQAVATAAAAREGDAAGLAAAVPAGAALDTLAEQSSWSSAVADGGRQEPAMPAWATETEVQDDVAAEPVADVAAGLTGRRRRCAMTKWQLPEAVTDLPRWDEPVPPATTRPVQDERRRRRPRWRCRTTRCTPNSSRSSAACSTCRPTRENEAADSPRARRAGRAA
jgi:pilus assembly protein FimV